MTKTGPSAEIVEIATGLRFPEGPIALPDGDVLLVEIERATLTRIAASGDTTVVAHLGGGPNGAAIGPDGACYVCNNGGFRWTGDALFPLRPAGQAEDYRGGGIQRVDLATGAFHTLYSSVDGRNLSAPNDIVFDRQGGFWFTDLGKTSGDCRYHGAVYYALADGSRIVRAKYPMVTPNGIGLSADEDTVYLAESLTSRVWAFDVASPGVLKPAQELLPGRLLATLTDYQLIDSLAVQGDGRVAVATLFRGGISVVDPKDGSIDYVDVPDDLFVTNICFGGKDLRDAFITCSGRGKLVRARWPSPGLRLNYNA